MEEKIRAMTIQALIKTWLEENEPSLSAEEVDRFVDFVEVDVWQWLADNWKAWQEHRP